jgi:hypothetical protein
MAQPNAALCDLCPYHMPNLVVSSGSQTLGLAPKRLHWYLIGTDRYGRMGCHSDC